MLDPTQRGSRFRTRKYLAVLADIDKRHDVAGALAAIHPEDPHKVLARMDLPQRLYRTSEIAAYFGLTRQTIHNYTTMGLITEHARTQGDHRLYDETVFATLDRIQRLKARHRLRDIRRVLETEERKRATALAPTGEADRRTDTG